MKLEHRFAPIQQEANIIKGVFEVTKYCLYQCNNQFKEGNCYNNCLHKWDNAQLLARSFTDRLVDLKFKENPKSF